MKWTSKRKGDAMYDSSIGLHAAAAGLRAPTQAETISLDEDASSARLVDSAEAADPGKAQEAVWQVEHELRVLQMSELTLRAERRAALAAEADRRAEEEYQVKKAQQACRKRHEADGFTGWIDSLELKMKKIKEEDVAEDGTNLSSTTYIETSSGQSIVTNSACSSEEEPSRVSMSPRAGKSTATMTPRSPMMTPRTDKNAPMMTPRSVAMTPRGSVAMTPRGSVTMTPQGARRPSVGANEVFYIGDVNCKLKADNAPATPRDGTVIIHDSDDEEDDAASDELEHPEDKLSSESVANLVSKWNNFSMSRCTSQDKLRPSMSRSSSATRLPNSCHTLSRNGTPLMQSRTPLMQSRTPLTQSRTPLMQSRTPLAQSTPLLQTRTPEVQSRSTLSSSGSAKRLSFTPMVAEKPSVNRRQSFDSFFEDVNRRQSFEEALAEAPPAGANAEWLMPKAMVWPDATDVPQGSRFVLQASAVGDYPEAKYDLELASAAFMLEMRHPKENGPLLRVPQAAALTARSLCRQPLLLIAQADGKVVASTGVRIGSLLDELFQYDGPLGCNAAKLGGVSLALWAPTALRVELALFDKVQDEEPAETCPMKRGEGGPDDGVWRINGPKEWLGKCYTYKICACRLASRQPETSEVPDPYSRACSADASRTLLCQETPFLGASRADWMEREKPDLSHRANAMLYSMGAQPNVGDEKHLRALAAAGVTHVHLSNALASGGSSGSRAAPMGTLFVPNGLFAKDLDGAARILDHQQLVSDLNDKGLRVVVDLETGTDALQLLEKCVPGYYCRHEPDGTDLPLFATERSMMERLVVDSMVSWVVEHRVDGLCFELASQMTLRCAKRCRAALNALTMDEHGVDGPRVLLYASSTTSGCTAGAEDSEEVKRAANQRELAGSGVSAHNYQAHHAVLAEIGCCMSRSTQEGSKQAGDQTQLNEQLGKLMDTIRFCLVASLRDYRLLEDCNGRSSVHARQLLGDSAMHVTSPDEVINCASVLSEKTLHDRISQVLHPCGASPEDIMRATWLCMAVSVLGHGVPHIRAGDELLDSGLAERLGVTPGPSMRAASTAKLLELLRIRASTPLLGFTDARDVRDKVDFPGCGAAQMPGIVVMHIRNGPPARFKFAPALCEQFECVVVVISFRGETSRVPAPRATGPLRLHPEQAASHDKETRTALFDAKTNELVVPPLSAIVFVGPQPEVNED